ncbi:MAG: hypothetical protein COV76_06415 [Candidatus Omnitrophica bacterium CG11_big_fil_rev_8_21_14_0_20_64_10]|nr:MAG: hypothetical protein COV76_06415 [Candidatus Omnitrophica bacterium CG11_big_fil_rev_8_21_14_0_20_64_10]
MPKSQKQEVVTFKVDAALLEQMRGIENRSVFIRQAILSALQNSCPLCKGTGTLSPQKREHWEEFSRSHRLKECRDCHEVTIVCEQR